jgi:hypothetical protein
LLPVSFNSDYINLDNIKEEEKTSKEGNSEEIISTVENNSNIENEEQVFKLTDFLLNNQHLLYPQIDTNTEAEQDDTYLPESSTFKIDEIVTQQESDVRTKLVNDDGSVFSLSTILKDLRKDQSPSLLSTPQIENEERREEEEISTENFNFQNFEQTAPDSLHSLFSQLRNESDNEDKTGSSFWPEFFSLEGMKQNCQTRHVPLTKSFVSFY